MADVVDSGEGFAKGLPVSVTGGVLSAMIARSLSKSSTTEVLEAVRYVGDVDARNRPGSLGPEEVGIPEKKGTQTLMKGI